MKRIILFISILFLCVLLSSCGTKNENSQLSVFQMSREGFFDFLSDPSIDYLQENNFSKSSFSLSKNDVQKIKNEVNGKEAEAFLVDDLYVYEDLIQFVTDGKALRDYLSENKIRKKISEAVIVYTPGLPVGIFVVAENEVYFISINEKASDIQGLKKYTYRLYKSDEYLKMCRSLIVGLEVIGPDGTKSCDVIIHRGQAVMPLLFIMQSLGAEMESSDDIITIRYSGKTFELNVRSRKLVDISDGNDCFIIPPGSVGYLQNVEGDILVDISRLNAFFDKVGVKINLDRSDMCYTVHKE